MLTKLGIGLLAGVLVPWASLAWDTAPHQKITKAALDSLPASARERFGAEAAALIEIYCIYPDRYQEMERFGFVRKSAGPKSAAEIRVYCVRPDGGEVHGATGDREEDLASLTFLLERIAASFAVKPLAGRHAASGRPACSETRATRSGCITGEQPGEAAKYAGVLSHYIADSLSPPHAVTPETLDGMKPWFGCGRVALHRAIEWRMPEIGLGGRAPRALGGSVRATAESVLARCYAGAEENRSDLREMVRAACAGDERKLDGYRARAGVTAAGILADAVWTVAGWR